MLMPGMVMMILAVTLLMINHYRQHVGKVNLSKIIIAES